MVTIHVNLKTGERRVIEENHASDQSITVFTQFLLPDILTKLEEKREIISSQKTMARR